MARTVEQTPVDDDSYDVSDIPPDAPEGGWLATPKALLKKSAKGNPMISISWKLEEAKEEDNENSVGAKIFDNLNFLPKGSPGAALNLRRIKALCDAFEIPATGTKADLVEAINGLGQVPVWTTHSTDKQTGEVRVNIAYNDPAAGPAKLAEKPDSDSDDDEEEEETERPAKKTAKKGRR